MFERIVTTDPIPTREDFIRESINLDESEDWELVSSSTLMKPQYKYSGAKFEIVQSYLRAIEVLSEMVSLNKGIKIISLRTVWVPFLFLCRHTAELAIKNALEISRIEIPKRLHNISKLWSLFVKSNNRFLTEKDYKVIDRITVLIDVLDEIDEDGSHFRYSTSNDNELYREKPYAINPKVFSDEVHGMVLALISIDPYLFC